MRMSQLEFLSEELPVACPPFEITTKPATAALNFKTLIAGIEQPIRLHVSGGSFIFPPDAKITLKCSKNLRIRMQNQIREEDSDTNKENPEEDETFENILNVLLANFKSFEERDIPLEVLTDMPGRKLTKSLEHHITLSCPWSRTELQIPIEFQPAIEGSCHLHTCGTQKFLQVIVRGLEAHLYLTEARVHCDMPGVRLIDLNPPAQRRIVCNLCLNLFFKFKYLFHFIQLAPNCRTIEWLHELA